MPDELALIKEQLDNYHLAIDLRQNSGTAAQHFVANVEKILDMPYVQGEAVNRSSKMSANNADARGKDKEETPGLP